MKSTTFWIVVWILLLDLALLSFAPLRHVHIPGKGFSDQDPLAMKMASISSPFTRFDTLLVGSSTLLAISGADALNQEEPIHDLDFRTSFETFDRLYTKRTNKKIRSFNFSYPGAMTSEMEHILYLSEKGRKIERVMVFLVPYSMIANSAPQKSRVATILESKNLLSSIVSDKSVSSKVLSALGSMLHLFEIRTDYSNLASFLSCAIFKRPADQFSAANKIPIPSLADLRVEQSTTVSRSDFKRPPEAETKKQHEFYKESYNPLNEKRFESELASLRRIAEHCRNRGIDLTVVACPTEQTHKDLLQPSFRERYINEIDSVCRESGARFVDYFSPVGLFGYSDFGDEGHLNPRGAQKFVELLAAKFSR